MKGKNGIILFLINDEIVHIESYVHFGFVFSYTVWTYSGEQLVHHNGEYYNKLPWYMY